MMRKPRNNSRPGGGWRQLITRVLVFVALIAVTVTMVLPFIWMVSTSLKSGDEAVTGQIRWLPRTTLLKHDGQQLEVDIVERDHGRYRVRLLQDLELQPQPLRTAEQVFAAELQRFEPAGAELLLDGDALVTHPPVEADDRVGAKVTRKVWFDRDQDLWLNYQIEAEAEVLEVVAPPIATVRFAENTLNASLGLAGQTMTKVPSQDLIQKVSLNFGNYLEVLNVMPFLAYYRNSIIVAVCVTLGQIVTSAMAAYAFARMRFPFRESLFFAYLATLMIPAQVTMIPLFILMSKVGLANTLISLILPGMFGAYGTFMLRQYFLGIPREIEEAATIDGAGHWGVFLRVIAPMSKPAIVTLVIFTAMQTWNAFVWPLIMISDDHLKTLPIGIAAFNGTYSTDWTLLMAGCVMMVLPLIVLFLFGQRFFVRGIQLGAVKG
jgi:multiple sugar transport system permease protein